MMSGLTTLSSRRLLTLEVGEPYDVAHTGGRRTDMRQCAHSRWHPTRLQTPQSATPAPRHSRGADQAERERRVASASRVSGGRRGSGSAGLGRSRPHRSSDQARVRLKI